MRRTKIVCTLGPASESLEVIISLIRSGMDVARLNFSHGSLLDHERRIRRVRESTRKTRRNVGILMDTRGPEVRIGTFRDGSITLQKGDLFTLTTREIEGDQEKVSVTYPGLVKDVKEGGIVLLDDGLIYLKILQVEGDDIRCKVINGGTLSNRKGLNFPGISLSLPFMCQKDRKDILYGISQDLDFVAASFTRKASDILEIRELLEQSRSGMLIIAKIENEEGVKNLEEILEVADGIMIARGDLGVEIPPEDVPIVQKMVIKKCNEEGKPVITATQMLDSMIRNPRPTRAEASDVANAIFDGTDAIMLSGETAVGRFPLESTRTMDQIALRTESALQYREIIKANQRLMKKTVTDAISYATCFTAFQLGASAIISSTQSGFTARMASKYKPEVPIVAVTTNPRVVRQLNLSWGVYPLSSQTTDTTDEMFETAVETAQEAGLVKNGDLVIFTAGVPVAVSGATNLLRIHTVGKVLLKGMGIGKQAVIGKVRLARSAREASKIQEGDILVSSITDADYVPFIQKAGAFIVEEGGLTSHGAIVGLTLDIPVIVGATGATEELVEGMLVTIDPVRGLVYQGKARVL